MKTELRPCNAIKYGSNLNSDGGPMIYAPEYICEKCPNRRAVDLDAVAREVREEMILDITPPKCRWNHDNDGFWYVPCRDQRVDANYLLEDNDHDAENFTYCPYCGKLIEVKK
jgi:hypothetical protein